MDFKECLVVASFCVLILAGLSLSETFELYSPPSVIGNVGQDAILPCQISLGTQPQNMEVQWKKFGEDHYDSIYHFSAVTNQETYEPSYVGRAAVATKEGIAIGNVSLELKTIQISDGGTYTCIVKSSHWVAESQIVLHITALGNVSIEVLDPEGEGTKLVCKSTGWFPEPELQWLLKSSPNPQLESQQNHKQLFNVWSSITVLGDMREITCSVRERSHLQRKREATIHLSGDIFPHTSPWFVAFWIFFILTLLTFGVLTYFTYKEKQKKTKRKRDEEEQVKLLEELEETKRKCEEQERKLEEKEQLIKSLENQLKTKEAENQFQIKEPDHQSQSYSTASNNISQTSVGQHPKSSFTGLFRKWLYH